MKLGCVMTALPPQDQGAGLVATIHQAQLSVIHPGRRLPPQLLDHLDDVVHPVANSGIISASPPKQVPTCGMRAPYARNSESHP